VRVHHTIIPLLLALPPSALPAQQARVAELGRCATEGGAWAEECRLTYRTYGRLNAARDNAVLIPTWYAGRSEDMTWMLGADAWVDTTRYFAVLVDALGNGASTSPSTSKAQPGRRFPRITIGDMVMAEHRLITETLGLRRLHAVLGWSMGGMQAIEWAHRFPGTATRVAAVAGTPRMATYDMYFVRMTLTLLDHAEARGLPPRELARQLTELWHLVGMSPAQENTVPRDSVDAMIARELELEFLRLHPEDNRLHMQAIGAFDRLGGATATPSGASSSRMLLVFFPEDHVTTAGHMRAYAARTGADTVAIASPYGHMAAPFEAATIGRHLRAWLDAPR